MKTAVNCPIQSNLDSHLWRFALLCLMLAAFTVQVHAAPKITGSFTRQLNDPGGSFSTVPNQFYNSYVRMATSDVLFELNVDSNSVDRLELIMKESFGDISIGRGPLADYGLLINDFSGTNLIQPITGGSPGGYGERIKVDMDKFGDAKVTVDITGSSNLRFGVVWEDRVQGGTLRVNYVSANNNDGYLVAFKKSDWNVAYSDTGTYKLGMKNGKYKFSYLSTNQSFALVYDLKSDYKVYASKNDDDLRVGLNVKF